MQRSVASFSKSGNAPQINMLMQLHLNVKVMPMDIEVRSGALNHSHHPCHSIARPHVRVPFFSSKRNCAQREPSASLVQMTDTAIAPARNASTTPKIASKHTKIERVTGKVRVALEAMVWDCLPRAKAAKKAGISEHGLYKALRKPPVKAFYMAQLEVLRTSERARNIHTLVDVRDQKKNQMARVQAVKALEQIDDVEHASRGTQMQPGLQIVVIQSASASPSIVDVTRDRHAIIDASTNE
jgi:hypothetical protein